MNLGGLLLTCSVCFFHFAHAVQVYKCEGASGETIYQNDPCPNGSVTVAHGSYARQPDDPRNQQAAAAQAAADNARRDYEIRATAATSYDEPATMSVYEQETAARRAQIEGGSHASRVGHSGRRAKTQDEVAAAAAAPSTHRNAPSQILAPAPQGVFDQNGTFYAPAGPNGIVNTQTGQFMPKAGNGYIDPATGQYFPAH